jgi:hypothetical protein
MCKKQINFFIYCIEIYRKAKNMSGSDVMTLFDTYGVTDFIIKGYEALHTEGSSATIWEIDDFLAHHTTTRSKSPQ